MTLDQVPGAVKASGDIVSVGIVAGTIAQQLPHIAAILTIFWTLIRIYETETVRALIRRASRSTTPAMKIPVDREKHDG